MLKILETHEGKTLFYLELPDNPKLEDIEVFMTMVKAAIDKRIEQKEKENKK